MLFTLPPWQYHRRTYLGRIDRVDASAARWDEEGFLQCHLRYQEDPLPFYRTPDIHFGWLWGCENKAKTLAYYEYRLGQGIKKDTGIWFLLASIVDHTGRTQAPHPVGEYAGMGTGILASHRNRGVGRAFLYTLMACHIWSPEQLGYSPGGLATAQSAHRQHIREALANGCAVPPSVVADYPELVKQIGTHPIGSAAHSSCY